jgi:hypothetical protein
MDRLAVIRNIIGTQSNVISSSTRNISAVLQGGATATQEIIRLEKKKKKEESQNKVDPEKDELQTFGETLKAATVDYTKITLLQHLYTLIISFVGVSGCKGGCF